MRKRCYYDILGVSGDADKATIKKAYRRLAIRYHPDRNPDDRECERKFRDVSEAYEVLSSSIRRTRYDRQRKAKGRGSRGGGGGYYQAANDYFADLFGASADQGRIKLRGNDLRYNLEIRAEEAASGKTMTIEVPAFNSCFACSGSGIEPGSEALVCPRCQGRGQIQARRGLFPINRACPLCEGIGRIVKDPCASCKGDGWVRSIEPISIEIPPGVQSGTRLKLARHGEPGERGGVPGDLYVAVYVADNPHLH